jgi:hypothetical protein
MSIPNKQIGWSNESNLLWQVSKDIDRLTTVTGSGISNIISLLNTKITNEQGVPSFFAGTLVNIPSPGETGRMFVSTDTFAFYRDNGTGWDLIGGPGTGTVTGSGATGQISYWNGTSTQTGSNNLFWDAANSRLGIKSSTPLSNLEVKTTNDLGLVRIYNNDDASSPLHLLRGSNGVVSTNTFTSNGTITSPTDVSASGGIMRITGNIYLDGAYRGVARMEYFTTSIPTIGNPPTGIRWLTTDNSYSLNERVGITSNGNLQIGDSIINNRSSRLFVQSSGNTAATWTARFHNNTGSSNSLVIDDAGSVMLGTATSGGQRLQVNGDTFLKGSGSTSTTLALTIQNSSSTNLFRILNDGTTGYGAFSENPRIYSGNNAGTLDVNGASLVIDIINGGSGKLLLKGGTQSPAAGQYAMMEFFRTFSPSSGTATFNTLLVSPTINQTGGASGVTRGIYIAPTITSASDYRAIEWTNNSTWGLYGSGSAKSYFGGRIQLGSTASIESSFYTALPIVGGATASGIYQLGNVSTAVTTLAAGFWNDMNTNTSVNLSQYMHFRATEGTIGAGTTITTQTGYHVGNLITGTTIIAFRGLVSSGTNKYNLYLDGTANNYMAGNLLLGTTTDGGQRLQVIGDTLLRGSGTTSATNALLIQNSASVKILSVRNDRLLELGSTAAPTYVQMGTGNSSLFIYATSNSATVNQASADGYMIGSYENTNSAYSKLWLGFATGFGFNSAAGESNVVNVQGTFVPTSGTSTFNSLRLTNTINQTGGANGVSRGLFISPTLTAAADWRSIEWSNNTGWGLYGTGSASNVLFGALGIGTNSSLDVVALRQFLSFTATRVYGIRSDASNAVGSVNPINISSALRTATSAAVTTFTHFSADEVSIGAGSTIGSQYGYFVGSNFTSATNNFGFYGNIASGTGRWNLYMNGTANNYFNGNVAIGSTANTGDWINIAASTTAKAHIYLEAGTAPTSPNNGDIWFDGTDLKMRIGGVTKTFAFV